MLRRLLLVGLLAMILGPAVAEVSRYPLVSMEREAFENAVWDYGRAKIGHETVVGTIQGLGGSADAVMTYNLKGKFEYFEARVGFVEGTPSGRAAVFEVWADGVLLYNTQSLTSGQEPELIRVPVAKRQLMQLRIRPDKYEGTHGAAWGEPMLINGAGPDFMQGLTINNYGRITRLSSAGKTRDVEVTIPLTPGEHEYTVKVKYDEKAGRVDIETVPAGGGSMPQTVPFK